MVALWLSFATGLAFSLRWLQKRFVTGAIFGFFAAPLAYYAGMKLGAIRFDDNVYATAAQIAVAWLLAMPLLLGYREWVYRRFSTGVASRD